MAYVNSNWDLHVHAMENMNSESMVSPLLHSPSLLYTITLSVKK